MTAPVECVQPSSGEQTQKNVERRLASMARLSRLVAERRNRHKETMMQIREDRLKPKPVMLHQQSSTEDSTAPNSMANLLDRGDLLLNTSATASEESSPQSNPAAVLAGLNSLDNGVPRISPIPLSHDFMTDEEHEDAGHEGDDDPDNEDSPRHILNPFCITWKGSASREVILKGTFTTPYWQESLHLCRDRWGWSFDISRFGLAAGTYLFKFVVDGEWKISPDYQVIVDKDGNTNNSIFISSSRRPLKPIQSQPIMERTHVGSPGGHSDSDRSAKVTRRAFGIERQVTDSLDKPQTTCDRLKPISEKVPFTPPATKNVPVATVATAATSTAVSTPKRYYDVLNAVPACIDIPRWVEAAQERQREGLAFVCGAWMIPHPEKVYSGGEDAFYYSTHSFGIADGVGEWEFRFKINPRKFAEELMFGAMQAYDTVSPFMSGRDRANHCLTLGYDNTESFGSSTAAIAVVNQDRSGIGIANLGDSGILHLRKAKIGQNLVFGHVVRTADQQHSWNMPFQLTRLPRIEDYDMLEADPAFTQCIRVLRTLGGAVLNKIDSTSHADLYDSDLVEGDMLLAMTDGVKDNLWNHEMVRMIQSAISPFDAKVKEDKMGADDEQPAFTDPEAIAKAIAEVAFAKSQLSSSYRSPFSVEMRRQCGGTHHGGKPDDISVVVAWVVKESEAPRLCEQLNRSATGIMTAPQWWRERAFAKNNKRSEEQQHEVSSSSPSGSGSDESIRS